MRRLPWGQQTRTHPAVRIVTGDNPIFIGWGVHQLFPLLYRLSWEMLEYGDAQDGISRTCLFGEAVTRILWRMAGFHH
jgi:hypothetical protein